MTRDSTPSSSLFDQTYEPILEALDRAYASVPPVALREAMDRAVYARLTAPRPAARRRVRLPVPGRRPLTIGAALLLVLSGLAGYLHLSSPTPVSAQPVLRRAAAVQLPPGSALHLVYRVTVTVAGQSGEKGSGLHPGTADVWIESDAAGHPVLSAQTLTLAVKNIVSRYIQANGETYAYNPELRGDNVIAISSESRLDPSWLVPNHMFDGTTVARYLNQPSQQQGVQRLPDQTLDGHAVDVVQVDGGPDRPALRTTFYFDAHTYVLRGFDATAIDSSYPIPTWQVRLASDTTMPAASVPPHTFTLNAPPDARVELPAPDFAGFATAFEITCDNRALNIKAAIGSGQTPLAVCRQTNPGVTEAQLVEALAAPLRHDLEAALAAGQISAAQEATALQDLQDQMVSLVTTSRSAK
ncbi:MAG: hypothetical protein JOZ41_10235 [Chloroflexi bacterium]|nr:hypothetical protein [Chloroflexota bacterium]